MMDALTCLIIEAAIKQLKSFRPLAIGFFCCFLLSSTAFANGSDSTDRRFVIHTGLEVGGGFPFIFNFAPFGQIGSMVLPSLAVNGQVGLYTPFIFNNTFASFAEAGITLSVFRADGIMVGFAGRAFFSDIKEPFIAKVYLTNNYYDPAAVGYWQLYFAGNPHNGASIGFQLALRLWSK